MANNDQSIDNPYGKGRERAGGSGHRGMRGGRTEAAVDLMTAPLLTNPITAPIGLGARDLAKRFGQSDSAEDVPPDTRESPNPDTRESPNPDTRTSPNQTETDVRESPRDLEEGPIQTVPDMRTSPDDPEEHIKSERHKASDKAYKALEEAYDLDQMGSDQRAIFEDFVGSAMTEGRSLEEIMAALDHPDAASYIGISRRQPEPTSLERLRMNAAESATRKAEIRSEQEKRARYLQAQESIMADPNLNSDRKAGALEDASRKIYGTDVPPR